MGETWEAGYFNDIDREFHKTFDKHADEVIGVLKKGTSPPIHAREGYRALKLAYCAIDSFKQGVRTIVE